MADKRHKDAQWHVADDAGRVTQWDQVQVAILMDLRDELKKLNAVFSCHNFLEVPQILREIRRNTRKPKKKAVAKGKPALRVVSSR